MTNLAKNIIDQLSPIVEGDGFGNPDPAVMAETVKGAVEKLAAIQFKSDKDKSDYLDRVANRFGRPVADFVGQYAGNGNASGATPSISDPVVKQIVTNLNGILGMVP